MSRETVEDITNYPIRALPERHISLETAQRFGIRTGVSEKDGTTPVAWYFPYHKGDISGFKKKDLTLDKGDRFHFSTSGSVDLDCELFGAHLVSGGRKLFICEGEGDAAILYQTLKEGVKGTKYEDMQPAVVSIGLGTSNAVKHIANNIDYINAFQEVILCFDQDEATPSERKKGIMKGWDAVAEVAHLIPHVKAAKYSKNDPCDMVAAGKGKELRDAVMFNAERYRPRGILNGSEIAVEDLWATPEKGYGVPYPELQKKIRGLRKGEIVTLTAGSGTGKSTLARELAYHLNNEHQAKIGNIFLEEDKYTTAKSYIAIDNNVPLPELRFNPSILTEEQWKKSHEKLINNGRWFAIDHFGSLDSRELMEKFRYLAAVEKCDFIILDHISMVFSGQESNNERKDIDLLMTELAAFVNEMNVGVLVIVHLSRNKGKQSYYEGGQVSLQDLRGSGSLEQLSWEVLALERDQQGEEADVSRIRVLKNRTFGKLGIADQCVYNQDTGRLLPMEEEY